MLDVTPLSLGVETGRRDDRAHRAEHDDPDREEGDFSTAADNQTAVTINVLQGERRSPADNRLLGKFNLEGIPPAPLGMPQIEVTFNIDVNGILNVSAKDKGTGKEKTITIELRRPVEGRDREDEARRRGPRRRGQAARELAEARNAADQASYQAEKLLNEHKGQLTDADTAALRSAIAGVEQARRGTTRPRSRGRSTTSGRPARPWESTSRASAAAAAQTGPVRPARGPAAARPTTSSTWNSKTSQVTDAAWPLRPGHARRSAVSISAAMGRARTVWKPSDRGGPHDMPTHGPDRAGPRPHTGL